MADARRPDIGQFPWLLQASTSVLYYEIIAAQSSRFEAESFASLGCLRVLVNGFFDGLVYYNPTKGILSAQFNRKSSVFKLNMDNWMISGESGHFGVVNGEVTTVVDPVVRETPRKNSTNGRMNNNNNNNI